MHIFLSKAKDSLKHTTTFASHPFPYWCHDGLQTVCLLISQALSLCLPIKDSVSLSSMTG